MGKHDYIQDFERATKAHIALVNKYANKIGKEYLEHDRDKLFELKHGFALLYKPKYAKIDEHDINAATKAHIQANAHHPEFWTTTSLYRWRRDNTTPFGVIDATKMPESALEEMCCDWCARSEEFNNSPFDWFDKVNGVRWYFSEEQVEFIKGTLAKLWE